MEGKHKNINGIMKSWGWYLLVAVILAGICTYITYPGVYYSDSFTRWYFTENIISNNPENINNGLSVVPQYIMAVLYRISGEYGFTTFVQAAAFYFTSFLTIDRLCTKYRWLFMLLFVACPIFYAFSIYLEMSVGLVTGINVFILISLKAKDILPHAKAGHIALITAGYIAVAFMMFGFRQNSVTMIPVMVTVIVLVSAKLGRKQCVKFTLLQTVALVATLVFIGRIPYMMNYAKVSDLTCKGTLWDAAKTLRLVWDNEEYHDYFDFLGENATETLVESVSLVNIHGHYSKVRVDYSQETVTNAINRRYLKLIVKEPGAFIASKWDTILRVMGVIEPIYEAEYEYDWGGEGLIEDYGVRHSKARELFIGSYKDFQAKIPVFRMPYLIYIFVLALFGIFFKKLDKNARIVAAILFFGACFYYGAFFISAQSHEFRYFFPAFYMLCIAAFSIISNINVKKER